jgi:hypothetical protein
VPACNKYNKFIDCSGCCKYEVNIKR